MANQDTAARPPATVSGNLKGTLAGVVATVAVGIISQAGYLAPLATFLSNTGLVGVAGAVLTASGFAVALTPQGVATALAMAVIGGAANYAVTHYSGLKKYADMYAALPTATPDYTATLPKDGAFERPPVAQGPSNGNFNKAQ